MANVLAGNPNLFASILGSLLKDELPVISDYMIKHPRVFYTLLADKPELLAYAVRMDSEILHRLMRPCRDDFTRLYLEYPDLLVNLFTASPSIVVELFHQEPQFLQQALMQCPDTLSTSSVRPIIQK